TWPGRRPTGAAAGRHGGAAIVRRAQAAQAPRWPGRSGPSGSLHQSATWPARSDPVFRPNNPSRIRRTIGAAVVAPCPPCSTRATTTYFGSLARSEERRVGKEWDCRFWASRLKEMHVCVDKSDNVACADARGNREQI